jgi:Zn-finger nucleic acid-binding protein
MQCPIDGSQLVMTDRSGVEIDYCPQCRGVWLDRGELDKIIERSAPAAATAAPPPQPRGYGDRERPTAQNTDYGRRDQPYGSDDHHKRKKRGGFLEDLFDF